MPPSISTGNRQVRWCAAVQTAVNSHCKLGKYSVSNVKPVKLIWIGPRRTNSANISMSKASTNEINHACLYSLAAEHHRTLAGTHFASRWRQEAKLAWVTGYIPRWFARPKAVTHPSSNRARCRAISLIRPSFLRLSHTDTTHIGYTCYQSIDKVL